jgi:nucleoside-diphosphate-sugar epimerase
VEASRRIGRLTTMRILLTGHDGYIGTIMSQVLTEADHEVIGLDSGLFDGCIFGEDARAIPFLAKDVRDVAAADLEGFEAVIHLAAISNDPLGNLNPNCTYEINHAASIRLAELARDAGVTRFVYSSSCSVYGAASPEDILDESASFNPVTPYAKSKVMVEDDLHALARDGFSPTYMRNATVYGVSPRLRGDLVVNNLVGWALTTGRVHLKSDGTPWRPLVHVEDLCRAFAAVLDAPCDVIHDEAFNVGRVGENYRISDVAEMVERAVEDSVLSYEEGAGPDPRCYRVDFGKISERLPGFEPSWTVERGVDQLLNAYREIGLRQDDLEGDRYLRIKHISRLLEEERIDSDLRWKRDTPR